MSAFLAKQQVEQRTDEGEQPDDQQPGQHAQRGVVVLKDHDRFDDMAEQRDKHDYQEE
jgi:hypothetical protein